MLDRNTIINLAFVINRETGLGRYSIHTEARRERLAWAWNVSARREFSRLPYSIHPVSVKTIIVVSFSLSRKHVIVNCHSFLLLCVIIRKYKRKHIWWIRYIFKKRGTFWSYFNLLEIQEEMSEKWRFVKHGKGPRCRMESGLSINREPEWNIVAQ